MEKGSNFRRRRETQVIDHVVPTVQTGAIESKLYDSVRLPAGKALFS